MTSKVSNFIKQYFFMLALAATFVGFSAFKLVPEKQADDDWFEITIQGSPNQKENQIIDETLDNPPELEAAQGECRIENEADPCAVHLNLPTGITPSMLENLSVDDAETLHGVTIGDGYAKQWLEN